MPSLDSIANVTLAACAVGTLIVAVITLRRVARVEKHTNGMVAQLEAAAKAKGVIEGRADKT